MSWAWAAATRVYCAEPPSHSDPKYHGASSGASSASRRQGSISTRCPIRPRSTPSPTATTRPQTSAHCRRGKASGLPDYLASSAASPLEYHPMRVLMSVLLTPAAATSISTSPLAGAGRGYPRAIPAFPGRHDPSAHCLTLWKVKSSRFFPRCDRVVVSSIGLIVHLVRFCTACGEGPHQTPRRDRR